MTAASVGHRRRHVLLIAVVQVAALSCWFSASAVAPALRVDLQISDQEAVLLTSAVQAGFVVGAIVSAALNLPDRIRPTLLYGGSAITAAAATAALPWVAVDLTTAVILRFVTGVTLAGVYPVGMKLMASWTDPSRRGAALGVLVGALTLGSAMPQLIRGFESLSWESVMTWAAIITLAGGVLALLFVRIGPHVRATTGRLEAGYALRMFAERGPRLATLGYLGHMWELYALWAWLPTFLVASQAHRSESTGSVVNIVAFAAIGLAGLVGCLLGGVAADRFGRSRAAVVAMVVSGLCCVVSPLLFGCDVVVVGVFVAIWGAAVIADSGVFSTALSETANPRFVGTALTAQTAYGFALTIVTIHAVPWFAEWIGWQYALTVLAVGPLLGALAMARFSGPGGADGGSRPGGAADGRRRGGAASIR